jgi:putative acetyltransferase
MRSRKDATVTAMPLLRALTPADLDDVARVLVQSYGCDIPEVRAAQTPDNERSVLQERLFGSAELSGAFDGDELIGYVVWRPHWIDHLYVVPDRAACGVGTALLNTVKAQQTRIDLWTLENNTRARRFYEERGFVEVARQVAIATSGSQLPPDVLYRWLSPGV